jgi:hypothetical protein
MTLTRAAVEAILIRRCGRLLTAAGLDGSTIDGTNADLNDPIGWAARQCGLSLTSITTVTDDELAALADDDTDKLLDLAELRTLETIAENPDVTTRQADGAQVDLSDVDTKLHRLIERKQARIERLYGIGYTTFSAGVNRLAFLELL